MLLVVENDLDIFRGRRDSGSLDRIGEIIEDGPLSTFSRSYALLHSFYYKRDRYIAQS
jgi:hypothetical protein